VRRVSREAHTAVWGIRWQEGASGGRRGMRWQDREDILLVGEAVPNPCEACIMRGA
jgi:hypothetical protein